MRARIALIAGLVAACSATGASNAHAWTYGDTLTTIWRPLPNLPALVTPGGSFRVWATAPPAAGHWSASLRFGTVSVPLALANGGWQANKGRFEFDAIVPAGTPEEVWSLALSSDSTGLDLAQHCVKVLGAYKTDYYFAQISDTHLPEHTFSTASGINTADTTGMADFDAVIEDLNLIHPEFILHSGDLVNEGELEEYLGMYEMGRAQGMLSRLNDPVFVVTGNHDIGGWGPTPPPDGTSRLNWWRYFGWNFLGSPPPGDPFHSQDFTFDYGPLHVIGLEAYINSGSYDHYQQATWGAQSFTPEQMSWLQADVAAQPPGTKKLAFYHYDFGGTLSNGSPGAEFSQINPAALGLDAVIWGHNHGVAEGNLAARPINLGLRSVIDRRQFRIFRVSNGVITPGPMHASGGISSAPTDSLAITPDAPNNGTRSLLSFLVNNRFGERWDHARLKFLMADHDSDYIAIGGVLAQTIVEGGMRICYVDCDVPASTAIVVTVHSHLPVTGVSPQRDAAWALRAPSPDPYRLGAGGFTVRWSQPRGARVTLDLLDLAGRRVARLYGGDAPPGDHAATWSGRADDGTAPAPGVYMVRLAGESQVRLARCVVLR